MTDPSREQMLERIAEIQARVDATTEGPWFYNSYNGIFSGPKMRTYDAWFDTIPDGHTVERRGECPMCGRWKQIACVAPETYEHGCRFFSEDYDRDPEVASVPSHHGDTAIGKRAADAQFMADARQDVPWLLEQVRVLQERIAELGAEAQGQSWINKVRGGWIEEPLRRQVTTLQEHIAKVREMAAGAPENCGCHGDVCWSDHRCCCEVKRVDASAILAVLDGQGEEKTDG